MAEKHLGFTIIEIIISLSLLCILSISFLFLSTFYMNTMAQATQKYERINKGEQLLDQVVTSIKGDRFGIEEQTELEAQARTLGYRIAVTPKEGSSILEVHITQERSPWEGLRTLVTQP